MNGPAPERSRQDVLRPPPLTVIIPVINEEREVGRLVSAFRAQTLAPEILVCDGGSADQTVHRAQQSGARVIHSVKGRGAQMNAGAAHARADVLLFLHADSELLSGPAMLEVALRAYRHFQSVSGPICAGHFGLRFLRAEAGRNALYRYMEAKSRCNRPGTINGDQGLLISRQAFQALGGFDETLPIFEDQRISAKIFAEGSWLLLPGELGTSARRFEREGHFERYGLMALMMATHETGMPDFLAQARNVYAEQADARNLDFSPFAALARNMFIDELGRHPQQAIALGRYLRSNGWQLGLMLDLLLHSPAHRWERRLDRLCATPRLGTATDAIVGLVGAGLVLGVIPSAEKIEKRLLSQWR